jgi:hypothetical protein
VRRGGGRCVAAGIRHDVRSPVLPAWGGFRRRASQLKPNFFV